MISSFVYISNFTTFTIEITYFLEESNDPLDTFERTVLEHRIGISLKNVIYNEETFSKSNWE